MGDPKPVIPRIVANQDVEDAIAYYLREGGQRAALRFVEAVEKAYRHIGRQPGSGSPRHAVELDLPGLRSWPFTGFPHAVFYVERPDHIDVWRVLHGRQDMSTRMGADSG